MNKPSTKYRTNINVWVEDAYERDFLFPFETTKVSIIRQAFIKHNNLDWFVFYDKPFDISREHHGS